MTDQPTNTTNPPRSTAGDLGTDKSAHNTTTIVKDIEVLSVEDLYTLFHEAIDNFGPTLGGVATDTDKTTPGFKLADGTEGTAWDWIKGEVRPRYHNDPAFNEGFRAGIGQVLALLGTEHSMGFASAMKAAKDPTAFNGNSVTVMRAGVLGAIEHITRLRAIAAYIGRSFKWDDNDKNVRTIEMMVHKLHNPFMTLATAYVQARDAEKNATRH